MGLAPYSSSAVAHFDQDGKANLRDVLRLLFRARRRRADLQGLKFVFMTGLGEGPLLATRIFKEDRPHIIAVTLPPYFRTSDGCIQGIAEEVSAYLRAMKVDIITSRLPFDGMGAGSFDQEMNVIKSVLSRVGRSFPLCVQAVLQACDHGLIAEGEDVIGITGDTAAVITASTTANFLSPQSQFYVREFICKPRRRNEGAPEVGKTKILLPSPR